MAIPYVTPMTTSSGKPMTTSSETPMAIPYVTPMTTSSGTLITVNIYMTYDQELL